MIQFENIAKSYQTPEKGAVTILDDVDLMIDNGQFVCILGPSGCGKTTLLNLVAGFIKPSRGRVVFDGSPVTAPAPERGVVFQDAALFPWLTVRKNVAFGLRQSGMNGSALKEKTDRYLHMVGMEEHAEAFPHTLSGGMRQRVAIARVLALEPRALLMDEPFSSLDANSRERLQDELLRIREVYRHTLLYVTHSVEEAAYLADRVIIMGPPPRCIRGDQTLPPDRLRDRQSPELRELTAHLRASVAHLPCCIKPAAFPMAYRS